MTGPRVLTLLNPWVIHQVSVRTHAVHTAGSHWGGPVGQRTLCAGVAATTSKDTAHPGSAWRSEVAITSLSTAGTGNPQELGGSRRGQHEFPLLAVVREHFLIFYEHFLRKG